MPGCDGWRKCLCQHHSQRGFRVRLFSHPRGRPRARRPLIKDLVRGLWHWEGEKEFVFLPLVDFEETNKNRDYRKIVPGAGGERRIASSRHARR